MVDARQGRNAEGVGGKNACRTNLLTDKHCPEVKWLIVKGQTDRDRPGSGPCSDNDSHISRNGFWLPCQLTFEYQF
ncbi:hypothetical protein RRG08_002154 [Elysia crispata]|uniref:Uncharacterized protein n=1 Tax=Elysia crispata TaxID=231223 RepID=A0AAE0ZAK9_9GAST|nr:hypothetical protein RRG08_002154 [Elysia crispata]